jgi:hypothetical protein
MDRKQLTPVAYLLAMTWGWLWAWALQYTGWGRYLAKERTYVTVVVGVGVDLAIAGLILKPSAWRRMVTIVALSSVGIIARSLYNEATGTNR